MATIVNYRYISAASTSANPPASPDPSPSPTLPTKILLPKKKPMKYSTGMAPGDYGGPPTTTKLRKYWGVEKEDPLTSSDYIWNRDFMDRMKRLIEGDESSTGFESIAPPAKEESAGFLSFNRVMSLDSVEVDLSKQLSTPVKADVVKPIEAPKSIVDAPKRWKLAPTRREQDKWNRATKAATGGSDVMFREIRQPRGDPAVLAAQSREQYFKLKNKLQLLTVGVGGVGLLSAYISYTPEIAASFGIGLLGSFAYMRMLGSSVDALADGARGVMKGAIAQPRLLVPVLLVMVYNRWNTLLVPEYGIMELQLIPMLVGLFTYKIATFIMAIEEALTVGENTSLN